MKFFNLLFFLLVACSAKLPNISVGTKQQVDKTMSIFSASIIKVHFVLRCPNREFWYKVKLYESDVIHDDYMDIAAGLAFNDTYGLIDTWDTGDLSDSFEFTVKIEHNCREVAVEDEWYEVMKCSAYDLQCQFYFDVDLVTMMEQRPQCNQIGNCYVSVWY